MKQLLLSAFFTGTILSITAQWAPVNSGVSAKLDAIHFKDAQNGMCSGGFVNALVTSDGGATWVMSNDQGFRDYSFTSSTNGYGASIVSQSMAKTSNGGTSWTSITPPTSNSLWGVAAISATTAHFVGTGGVYWYTTNGGNSVQVGNSGTTALLTDIFFTSSSTGFIAVQSGEIRRTLNGGSSWSVIYDAPLGIALTEMHFVDAITGYATGSNGGIFKTTDGGANWQQQTTGTSSHFQGVHFYDANHGVLVGLLGAIFYTDNGGATWYEQSSGTTEHLYDVRMLSANSAIVIGDNGTILKNTTITSEVGLSESTSIEVSTFPNPVTDKLTIEASAPIEGVEVYNMDGRQLFTSGEQWLDNYSIDFSAFATGTYYLKIPGAGKIVQIVRN